MRVLVVNADGRLPQSAPGDLRARGWEVRLAPDATGAADLVQQGGIDAVLISSREVAGEARGEREPLFRVLEAGRVPTVMLGEPGVRESRSDVDLIDYAPRESSAEALASRLSTVSRYHRYVRRIESELENMQRLGKRLNEHFSEVDEEMRLASRLQRDFLPKTQEPLNGVTFRTIFRPASWVSGDIFDIFRVDEEHVACYVADAVGHGMAAGLLTIFIKQAVQAKHITADGYRVLDPSETMRILNQTLAAQTLPNAQFVTACYALLNTQTLELRYARAGHPYPLLLGAEGGGVVELKSTGGLLGLFDEEEFPSARIQLHPGDKVVLYTDGFEMVFQNPDRSARLDTRAYMKRFEQLAHLPLTRLVPELEAMLDADEGSLKPRDDVSIVAFQVPGGEGVPTSGPEGRT